MAQPMAQPMQQPMQQQTRKQLRAANTEITFSLYLVRHGVSCANLKKAMKQQFTNYRDPELTRAGQEKAVQRGMLFREYLAAEGQGTPIVGASVLLRAQQTAFLMMSPDYTHQLYLPELFVVPYISETGPSYWFQTDDNKPTETGSKKRAIVTAANKEPSLETTLRAVPAPLPSDAASPSIPKFIRWIQTYYTTLQTLVARQPPLYTQENEERYDTLQAQRQQLSERMAVLQTTRAFGTRTQERLRAFDPSRERQELNAQMRALNAKRSLTAPVLQSTSPPLVLFTHGNFIGQFIKSVTNGRVSLAKEDRPNYSAFEFTVTLRPGSLPILQYRGPVHYDQGVNANPESPYSFTSAINPAKECEDGGDRCVLSACKREAKGIWAPWRQRQTQAQTQTRRANRNTNNGRLRLAGPRVTAADAIAKPIVLPNARSSYGNVNYYEEENNQPVVGGGKRSRTRRHRKL
jgi:bisphosphoglycerate-dependent phosphoglycerate mutase